MNVFGYCRVSTTKQAEEGESLAVQQRQITGYAMIKDLPAPEFFVEEGVSGTKPLDERPAGQDLLARLKSGDVVICSKLDRMFRSALDALRMAQDLKSKGISLHMIDLGGDVNGNGISKLFFTIVSAVAEAERDRIAARVKETKSDQRKRGRHLGGSRPFGFHVVREGDKERGGILVPDEREQAAIARMRALREQGMPLRAISAEMEKDGFTISHEGVAKVLSRAEGQL